MLCASGVETRYLQVRRLTKSFNTFIILSPKTNYERRLMDESVIATMAAMKSHSLAIGLLFGLATLAGCASTKVTQQTPMTAPGLARPNQIWVYDFVAAASDMPADSSLAGKVDAPSTPPTAEEIEIGRNTAQ
jgi:hypothetical protein